MPTFFHGSKSRLWFNGRDISTYMRSMRGTINLDTADISTFGETYKKYIAAMQDATLAAEGIYDGAASRIDSYIDDAISASEPSVYTWCIAHDLIGRRAWCVQAGESNYEIKAGMSDAATFTLEARPQSTGGFQAGTILWAGSTISSCTTGTGASLSSSNGYGGTLYIQVGGMGSGSFGWQLENSGCDADYKAILTGSYTAACYNGYRVTASGNVNTWFRMTACPGGASTVTYHAVFCRNYFQA